MNTPTVGADIAAPYTGDAIGFLAGQQDVTTERLDHLEAFCADLQSTIAALKEELRTLRFT